MNRAETCKGEQDKHTISAAEILLSKLGYLLYCFHPWGFSSWYELPCPVSPAGKCEKEEMFSGEQCNAL